MMTCAPSATRRLAMPRPIPRLAPVTMATLFSWVVLTWLVLPRCLDLELDSGCPRSWFLRCCSQAEIATDELLHDLVRTSPDLGHPCITPRPRNAVLVHEPVTAVELDTGIEHFVLDLGRPPLRLGRVHRAELALAMGLDTEIGRAHV